MDGRRIKLEIQYNNQSISQAIAPFVTDLTFTDNLSGQADDLSISVGDRERKWMNNWIPEKSASLQASILATAGWGNTKAFTRKLGYFDIDQIDTSGPPNKVSIKATSVPESSTLRNQRKTRSWEKATFKKVAQDIASKNTMKLHFSSEENPLLDRVEQQNEADLVFLMRICNEAGFSLKVANKSLVIMDEERLEKATAVDTISRTDSRLKDYGGADSLSKCYKSCRVTYADPKKKKIISYIFTPPKPEKTSRVLEVNEEVSSEAEARRLARKSLRGQNKEACTFSLKMTGFLTYYAGQTLNITDFGHFDGKYLITAVSGSVGTSSETSLSLRKCLEGY
ncbi:phage late control D family protein [Bacillus sp. SJS]|uniref:phage late control D family protein n=1 Tax=Bacillus sp. SJS TaxID=1423321 RepID=UPI0004DD1B3B|nr:contractile injection system protein, VgrG/Pvc8 family [Bacillus sp. SJS]KZZ82529.1 hypothetical protein AS29_020785 [Bacillus sp. SJS]